MNKQAWIAIIISVGAITGVIGFVAGTAMTRRVSLSYPEMEAEITRLSNVIIDKDFDLAASQRTIDNQTKTIKSQFKILSDPGVFAKHPDASKVKPNSLQVTNVSTKTLEMNDSWWNIEWQARVYSPSSGQVDLKAEFLDVQGFVIDESYIFNAALQAGPDNVYSEYAVISANLAKYIVDCRVTISR